MINVGVFYNLLLPGCFISGSEGFTPKIQTNAHIQIHYFPIRNLMLRLWNLASDTHITKSTGSQPSACLWPYGGRDMVLEQKFSNGIILTPREHSATSGGLGQGGLLVAPSGQRQVRDAAKGPTMHRMAPTTKNPVLELYDRKYPLYLKIWDDLFSLENTTWQSSHSAPLEGL